MNDDILQSIQSFFVKYDVLKTEPVIVGVSGGVDSMVLLHACGKLGFSAVAAHVNYGLRGAESNGDEAMVKNYCEQHSIPCETLRVTDTERQQHEGSTQEWARNLRYEWFNSLKETHHARYILVAHHANDQTETMLMQFIRGGAGKSVYGMAEQNGCILRPLLSITKTDLLNYAQLNNIPWRADSSNESDAYTRNYIRHHLVPLIERINPHIHETIHYRSALMHEEQTLVFSAAQQFLNEHITTEGALQSIPVQELIASRAQRVILFNWLKPHGFTPGQIMQIADMCANSENTETARCSSPTHHVFVRKGSIVCAERTQKSEHIVVSELPASLEKMSITICAPQDISFTLDSVRQYLDADTIDLPLHIRPWHPGDRFLPLGSPGRQKVADFLIHAGVPAWEKDRVCVLESSHGIVAVLGHRIDDSYKITPSTRECLCIAFHS